ncbi:MAG: M28 family peptidase [Solirubrobacterales bacterium]
MSPPEPPVQPAVEAQPGAEGWLRERLEKLERIERPSASAGEREAAEWIVSEFETLGAGARIETEAAHGTYWWPLAIGAVAGAAGATILLADGSRPTGSGESHFGRGRSRAMGLGRRLIGGGLGLAGLAAIARDFPPHERPLRRILPKNEASNVVCELGDPEGERTVVLVSHHDAAHAGLIFHPGIPQLVARTGIFRRLDTSPMLMAPVLGGPALAALAAVTGSRRLAVAGAVLSASSTASMLDIALRDVVPGANDNGTAVVSLLELARRFLADPPPGLRIILLSAGAEESFSEGIRAFGERHFPDLPKESTFFINLDTVGSPHLTVLRGEGFLKMYEYPQSALDLADRTAAELGIPLYPNLRIRNGTDGLEPLAAGYPVVSICSCTEHKQPANYHWPNDLAENVDFDTVDQAINLAEAMTRSLATEWVGPG